MKTYLTLFLIYPFFSNCQDTIRISFDSKLNFDAKELNYLFHFQDNGKDLNIKGQDINNYVFKTPGLYRITTQKINQKAKYFSKLDNKNITADCSEIAFSEFFFVYVDSLRIVYQPESIETTKSICVNKPCDDISMYINVSIQNYNKTAILMPQLPIQSSGIGTEIIANLDSEYIKLLPGNHRIKYNLKGLAIFASHIQFNFDNIGGYTPIGLKEKIKDCSK